MGIIKNNKNILAIYRGDKKITSVLKNEKIIFSLKKDNYILSTITTTTENEEIKLFNNKIFFKSVVINDSINVDINSTTSYTFTTPGIYTIKYNLDETKTWFNSMFNGCFTLTSFDFTKAQTSQITDINSLFGNCYKLSDLDISTFDTSSVIKMSGTFQGCTSLTSLDLAHFNTSKVTDMSRLFSQCTALERLDLSNFDISLVTSFNSMFYNCNKLKYIRCKQAFYDWCITNQDAIKLPNAMREGGDGTWDIIDAPKNLIKASFTTTSENKNVKITNKKEYFSSITLEDGTNILTDGTGSLSYVFSTPNTYIVTYTVKDETTVLDNSFSNLSDLVSIDFSKFDSKNITSIASLVSGCSKLANINLNGFNTENVTNMNMAFFALYGLTSIDVSSFNTSKVTNMNRMFFNSTKITDVLDLSSWDTSNVTNFSSMLDGCYAEKLYLDNFSTENATSYNPMLSRSGAKYIRCKQAFKDWCIEHQYEIDLPESMREGGDGTWDIIP